MAINDFGFCAGLSEYEQYIDEEGTPRQRWVRHVKEQWVETESEAIDLIIAERPAAHEENEKSGFMKLWPSYTWCVGCTCPIEKWRSIKRPAHMQGYKTNRWAIAVRFEKQSHSPAVKVVAFALACGVGKEESPAPFRAGEKARNKTGRRE